MLKGNSGMLVIMVLLAIINVVHLDIPEFFRLFYALVWAAMIAICNAHLAKCSVAPKKQVSKKAKLSGGKKL